MHQTVHRPHMNYPTAQWLQIFLIWTMVSFGASIRQTVNMCSNFSIMPLLILYQISPCQHIQGCQTDEIKKAKTLISPMPVVLPMVLLASLIKMENIFSCVIPTYSPNAAVDVATYLDKAMIMVNDKLYLYIPATNELKNITIPYAQKIMINNISMFTYGEEKVVIPVQGTDEEKYVMVINENGELLSDPIPAYDYSYFSEDRLIVNTDSDSINVYDDKMNLVYSDKDEKFASEQIETLDLEPYANGVAVAYEHRGPDVAGRYLYLDPDGNVLFDKLDASSAIELQLNIDS